MYTIRERDNVSAGVPLSRDALSLWRFRREEDRVERTASTVRLTWASCCWRLCWEWRVWCSVRAVIVSNESSRLSTWLSSALWAKIAVLMKLYWLRIVAMMLSLTDESSDASPRKASKSDLRSLSPRLRRLLMLVMADFCSFSLCLMTPNSPVLFSTSFHSGNGAFAVSNLVAFAALHLFGSFVCVVVTLALLAYTLTPRGSPWHFARIVFLFKSISYSQMSLEIWFCFSTALSILAWTADIIAKDKTAVTILYILPVRNAEMYQNNSVWLAMIALKFGRSDAECSHFAWLCCTVERWMQKLDFFSTTWIFFFTAGIYAEGLNWQIKQEVDRKVHWAEHDSRPWRAMRQWLLCKEQNNRWHYGYPFEWQVVMEWMVLRNSDSIQWHSKV